MLVLSRKVGERLVLPDTGVTITVVSVRGRAVRLGFEAAPGVVICREEIYRRLPAGATPQPPDAAAAK
ncbi:MAG: carbon storage regulator [Gemmataceae bacterium]